MSTEIKANELRLYAIQTRTEITYRVRSDGQVCVVDTKGIIKIPGLSGLPPYNADEVLARADEFILNRPDQKPRTLSREEIAELLKARAPATAAQKEE